MKKIFATMLALFAIVTTARAQVQINATNFPDANFRNWLLAQDYGKDSKLTTAEIKAVTVIDVYKKSIANLKGIEHFTALTQLRCYDNQLTALDVSKNTKLTLLYCSDNQLTTLNVPKNTALVTLYCQNNKLTALDVSKNTALTQLWCYGNQIKGNNMLTLVNSLPKVSGNFYVINTAGSNAQNVITEAQVKIAKNKGWKVYDYNGGNKKEYAGSDAGIVINSTNFPDANFRSFLLAQNYGADAILTPAEIEVVTKMNVYGKSIANLKGIEHFTALTKLYCQNNKLTALDVSKNTALTVLDCSGNKLTALNMSKNTALTALRCAVNQIKGDNMLVLVNSLPMVKSGEFYVINTRNTSEGNVIMKTLVITAKNKGWKVYDENGGSSKEYAGSGSGIAINATNFPDANFRGYVAGTTIDKDKDGYLSDEEIAAVTSISVGSKSIKNLKGIEHFTALQQLNAIKNQLTTIDVSKNTELTFLNLGGNQLTSIDVSKNTKLENLYTSENKLTALDVSKNTKLTILTCYGNQIKGSNMLTLVNSLPKVTSGNFFVIDTKNSSEGNVCTKSQVKVATGKGWTVYDNNGGGRNSARIYAGSDLAIKSTADWYGFLTYPEDHVFYRFTMKNIATVTAVSEKLPNTYAATYANGYVWFITTDGHLYKAPFDKTNKKIGKAELVKENFEPDKNAISMAYNRTDGMMYYLKGGQSTIKSFNPANLKMADNDYSLGLTMQTLAINSKGEAYGITNDESVSSLYQFDLKKHTSTLVGSTGVPCSYVQSMAFDQDTGELFWAQVWDSDNNAFYLVDPKTGTTDLIGKFGGKEIAEITGLFMVGSQDITPVEAIEADNRETVTNNAWYSLDGKRLNGEPTKPGIYIRNGKKVVK